MKTWGIRIGLIVLGIVVLVIAWKYYICRQKAKKAGLPSKCRLFSYEPTYIQPKREYFRWDEEENKCYKITDYGKRMKFREVDKRYCEQY